ncbi:MAG: aldehyde dehydrogenase family protein [Polyangiaceae bacterium]|nr:aldehyde dehydrogenase family protein [Polyangiaceae bacterium]MCE7890147.1 aldehyde dehydrogenase family protein [Sorangiineae bacterium PRO1]MCL4751706.1 aldehyde dehydrogenase family protein [Myxococcales bacterium]
MRVFERHYIAGEWVPSTGEGSFDVVCSSTEEKIGSVPAGSAGDAERAVLAAAQAFPAWSGTPREERTALLLRVAEGLSARHSEIAELIASEVGMPLKLAGPIQVGLPVSNLAATARAAQDLVLEERVENSLVVREPVGVVACITPWNYPLNQVLAKVAPALAVGCTVVLKPSEVAPLSAFVLAEVMHAAGAPAGVFNLVSGDGPTVGEVLAAHPKVDMVSFTGSTRAGRRVAELAAKSIKRLALELGGKSANVILDDADLGQAVKAGVSNCYLNSGQTCSAWTRMLVPRARLAEATELAKAAAEKFTLGNALEGKGRLGPLVSAAQRERVLGYIRRGIEEGATLVTGGAEPPADQPRGFFVRPTVFSDVRPEMSIAQEEIFGPVLCIIPYDTEEDAIRIANDSIYGLGGGVWSKDAARAERVARRLRTGQVDINGGAFNPVAPFGGYKQSGIGREGGRHGLEEYLETKSLQL